MKSKIAFLLVLTFALLSGIGSPTVLAAPYDSYNYSYWVDAVPAPASYLPSTVISGDDLGIGSFNVPQDMFVAEDHKIYVADTGNNRVVVLEPSLRVWKVITQFVHDGKTDTFNKPSGIFVKNDGTVYVADNGNQRIVALTAEGSFVKQVDRPESDVLPSDFNFHPLKVAVDRADRIYVVAKGVFEGIMQFDSEGVFIGYMGTNSVAANVSDYFWKMISTKAQREQMVLFVPTEFSNLDMDDKDFVFATNIDKNTDNPIKRLNPSGSDVLKRYGYFGVQGDIRFPTAGELSGPSQFKDVKAGPEGTYSALDAHRGRIFTYDEEGNLLYIFGQKGTEWGTFKTATALERTEDTFLVLDAGTNRITLFTPSAFGRLVNQATRLQYEGKEQEAASVWKKVLSLNANYDIAYIGIGKAQLRQHEYKKALHNFKLAMNRKYYSVAYSRYRKELLREHLGDVFTAAAVLSAGITAFYVFTRYRRRRSISGAA